MPTKRPSMQRTFKKTFSGRIVRKSLLKRSDVKSLSHGKKLRPMRPMRKRAA